MLASLATFIGVIGRGAALHEYFLTLGWGFFLTDKMSSLLLRCWDTEK
jgi:hypothetical protein